MTTHPEWKPSLEAFFELQASIVSETPTMDDLCIVAGRDPRVWRDAATRAGILSDIVSLAQIRPDSFVLEVGCAAGFLSSLVAPCALQYIGVDLSETALEVARRLDLSNANFVRADGVSLPWQRETFDSVFCCDVVTNFPSIDDVEPVVREMLRVTKSGQPVLVGNVPDKAKASELPRRVAEVARAMELKFGPLDLLRGQNAHSKQPVVSAEISKRTSRAEIAAVCSSAKIVTFDFEREEFELLARKVNASVKIVDIHPTNPYHGFRFNAVFRARL